MGPKNMDLSSTTSDYSTNSNATPLHHKKTFNHPVTSSSSPPIRRLGSGTSGLTEVDNLTPGSCAAVEAESCSNKKLLPSSKYKGVVPQPNGKWGAQIYEKHHRVWLGTFNEESEAARAYDTAALRFRGRDSAVNFKRQMLEPETEDSRAEAIFLNSHSKAEIVDMLRKHTYKDELEQCKKKKLYDDDSNKGGLTIIQRGIEQLFEKAVTPSDVGKLNRLVIPKQCAEKHFIPSRMISDCCNKGVLLNFEDRSGRVWRFRYAFWNSSQSYVLTRGWSRFVKENNLRAGDVVSFHRSTTTNQQYDNNYNKQLYYIDWKARNANINGILTADNKKAVYSHCVRLFGVDISSEEVPSKRMREIGILGSSERCNKKPRVINALCI